MSTKSIETRLSHLEAALAITKKRILMGWPPGEGALVGYEIASGMVFRNPGETDAELRRRALSLLRWRNGVEWFWEIRRADP